MGLLTEILYTGIGNSDVKTYKSSNILRTIRVGAYCGEVQLIAVIYTFKPWYLSVILVVLLHRHNVLTIYLTKVYIYYLNDGNLEHVVFIVYCYGVKACTPVGENLLNGQGYFKVAWLIC